MAELPQSLASNKQKGNFAVASAISHFVAQGFTGSIPLADTAKYDLVIERNGVFQAVQCKYAGQEKRAQIFSVPLYVSGGNRSAGNRRIQYDSKDFDLLYVHCASGCVYVIPFDEIVGRVTINVGRNSKWSRWENYLQSTSSNCRSTEGSVE